MQAYASLKPSQDIRSIRFSKTFCELNFSGDGDYSRSTNFLKSEWEIHEIRSNNWRNKEQKKCNYASFNSKFSNCYEVRFSYREGHIPKIFWKVPAWPSAGSGWRLARVLQENLKVTWGEFQSFSIFLNGEILNFLFLAVNQVNQGEIMQVIQLLLISNNISLNSPLGL